MLILLEQKYSPFSNGDTTNSLQSLPTILILCHKNQQTMNNELIAAIIGAGAGLIVAVVGQLLTYFFALRNLEIGWNREDRKMHIERQIAACSLLLKAGVDSGNFRNLDAAERKVLIDDFSYALSNIQLTCPPPLAQVALEWAKQINLVYMNEIPTNLSLYKKYRDDFIQTAQSYFGVTSPIAKVMNNKGGN